MNIKGLQKTSLVDFPGRLSSVLFLGGCNLRCRYCYNPDLIPRSNHPAESNREDITSDFSENYSADYILRFLKKRSKFIDGVVITGGEPTLSSSLDSFLREIRKIPLHIKLDSNGSNPDVIGRLLSEGLIDYAAIDVKTSRAKYNSLTRVNFNFDLLKNSITLLKKSGIDYELRTTCVPEFVTLNDFEKIKAEISHVKKYCLQQFINTKTFDPSVQDYTPYPVSTLNEFAVFIKSFADICEIRGI
ncbi:MAG: anaerobic ribonucleoside-triphosphate reductase activating protein [Spirochaetes bacterium]|nr:anaerobic ribonucleoside-triphosphate reductase activating protein [Spirochaetota bacterium]